MALVIGKNPAGEIIDDHDGVTEGADQIVGNAGVDIIVAGGGNDIIKGGGGADTIMGGSGRDGATYEDSTVGVQVSLVTGKGSHGTAEGDTLISIEDLYGSKYDDTLAGDSHDNLLSGAGGNDVLKGGGGADVLKGGAGDDKLEIDGTDDHVYGGEGADTLIVASKNGLKVNLGTGFVDYNPYTNTWGQSPRAIATETGYNIGYPHAPNAMPQVTEVENVVGSVHNDAIFGDEHTNRLWGGDGDDLLSGLGGSDVIDGGAGKDMIFGGKGADKLTGGAEADTFIFGALDSKFINDKPQDIITDFQHGSDKIDLSALDIKLNDLLEIDNKVVAGVNYSWVGVDANHNGKFDTNEFSIAVKMAAGTTLHAGDFIF